eukprot:gene13102-biopygen9507
MHYGPARCPALPPALGRSRQTRRFADRREIACLACSENRLIDSRSESSKPRHDLPRLGSADVGSADVGEVKVLPSASDGGGEEVCLVIAADDSERRALGAAAKVLGLQSRPLDSVQRRRFWVGDGIQTQTDLK